LVTYQVSYETVTFLGLCTVVKFSLFLQVNNNHNRR